MDQDKMMASINPNLRNFLMPSRREKGYVRMSVDVPIELHKRVQREKIDHNFMSLTEVMYDALNDWLAKMENKF